MAKIIVLVRHGKAQLRSDELPDFERELTEAGVRALKAWLPRAARLLAAEPLVQMQEDMDDEDYIPQ